MPFVRIDMVSGMPAEYRSAVLHGVRDAVVGALGVPDERVKQRIIETPSENIDLPAEHTDRFLVVEVSMLPGRGPELKRALYERLVRNLGADPGIPAAEINVLISDPAAECFCIGGEGMGAAAGEGMR